MQKSTVFSSEVIDKVSNYIANTAEADLSAPVVEKAKHHILDTLAAALSGSTLWPGQVAKRFMKRQGGAREAKVFGAPTVTTAINAAFANAIMAHADETDDSHPRSNTHPGCAIVPAALAMAEKKRVSGLDFLKGVVAGYDIGCRMTIALGVDAVHRMHRCTHSIGNTFGAAAASASIAKLRPEQVRYALSYTAQQTSGVNYWARDTKHVEKAFVFGGMPARNGITSTILVQSGFSGVDDPFTGADNFFEAFSPSAGPERLIEELGSRFEIMATNIKKFPVGSPIQAPLDALLLLMKKYKLTPKNVKNITARLPAYSLSIVSDRDMPDVNLQYILAVTLVDGRLSFEAAHSYYRMKDRAVLDVRNRVKTIADPELSSDKTSRQGIIEITTGDNSLLREHVISVRGTAKNPLATEEVEEKCRDLMAPVIGSERTELLIQKIQHIEEVQNIRELRPLLSVP